MIRRAKRSLARPAAVAVVFVCLTACASVAGQPGWIENPGKDYPEMSYLTGLGSGETLESASANATAAIAQIFATRVDQVIRDRQATHSGADGALDEQSIESTTKLYTQGVVEGVEIKKSWKARGGPHWALAVLDKDRAADGLADRIRSEEAAIRSHVERADGLGSPLLRTGALLPALAPARERDMLAAQFRVVSDRAWAAGPTTADVEARIASERAATRFAVTAVVVEESTGSEQPLYEMRDALADALSERGFQIVSEGSANARVTSRLTLSAPFERGSNRWVHHLWSAATEMRDASGGRALLVHQVEGSASHPQAPLARKRALAEARERVVPGFAARFDAVISGDGEGEP